MDQVHDVHPEVPLDLLKDLGLDDLPSREEIHQEIQERLFAHPEKLPENWLPTHQMYVYPQNFNTLQIAPTHHRSAIGSMTFAFLSYCPYIPRSRRRG
jgi:hypothetical protein